MKNYLAIAVFITITLASLFLLLRDFLYVHSLHNIGYTILVVLAVAAYVWAGLQLQTFFDERE